MADYQLETRGISSLEKIFPDSQPGGSFTGGSLLRNERYSFQAAYRCPDSGWDRRLIRAECEGPLREFITIRAVGLVPSELPCYTETDGDYERTIPGLFPDPLLSLPASGLPVRDLAGWRSVWVDVDGRHSPLPTGDYPVSIRFLDAEDGVERGRAEFVLHIIDALLPRQELRYTCWIYFDCIAQAYGVPLFSETFWSRAEQFVRVAAGSGINTLLTPLVTPPLETAWGAYRTPVQLVEIWREPENWRFDFSRLRRFVKMARDCGIETFEIGHLFSQWGAERAPQVIAWEDGSERRIFGWDTDARSSAYREFLLALLKAFHVCAAELGITDSCLYHVSDEPAYSQREAYAYGRAVLEEALGSVTVIDAVSEFELYRDGVVTTPVPATDQLHPFLDAGVPGLWCYYCSGQVKAVSNRFFSMPSSRNRILGFQLYRWDMTGFLHWGFNHYNTQHSREQIDPFRVTDAGLAWPSGDAFCVYPGPKGPLESLRLLVFAEGLADLRACRFLESLIGRKAVLELIDKTAGRSLAFDDYPHGADFLLTLRERVNRKIERVLLSSDIS